MTSPNNPNLKIAVPEPGLYPGVEANEYFSWPLASASRLNQIARSPAHAKAWDDRDDDDNKAKARGTGGHAAILEPDTFASTYAEGPCVKLNTTIGKEKWAEFVNANPGKVHVRGEEWPHLIGMRDAVMAHPFAGRLFREAVHHELAIVWDDPETGVRCKGRLDALYRDTDGYVIPDLKCVRDARRRAFSPAIAERGYHRQAAMYLRGLAANGIPADVFAFVCVENVPPYAVMVYALDDVAIAAGDADLRGLLTTYDECRRSGKWPGYRQKIQTIGLPKWHGHDDEENEE